MDINDQSNNLHLDKAAINAIEEALGIIKITKYHAPGVYYISTTNPSKNLFIGEYYIVDADDTIISEHQK